MPFSRRSDRKEEKSVVSFTHEQNIICSQKELDDIAHGQGIICRQLSAGHMEGSSPINALNGNRGAPRTREARVDRAP